jgi:P27 family predicted phage terminase small subunit
MAVPRSTRLKARLGTIRADRQPADQGPRPAPAFPTCPPGQSKEFRDDWAAVARLIAPLNVAAVCDAPTVGLLVRTIGEDRRLTATLDRDGWSYTVRTARGTTMIRPHPAAMQLADTRRRLLGLLREFGLTPSARGRVEELAPPTSDPLEDMLRRQEADAP